MKCMKLTGDNFLTFDIPYPYFSIEIDSSKLLDNKIKFAYIGRISDQKNIDVLVEAYYLLSLEHDNLPPFLIYGKEDHFGSPNMGIPSTECLKYLKDQIEKLNLTKKIIFKGFQSREVLVSHWGGHIPFQEKCPHKIWTVPVEFKNSRPRPDPIDFKNQMQIALEHSRILFDKTGMDSIPDYFLPDQIIKEFAAVLEKLSSNAEPLNISQTAREMYQQQLQYENAGDMQRVFASYDDHKAQLYLNAYRE
jgi:hypothetical protein